MYKKNDIFYVYLNNFILCVMQGIDKLILDVLFCLDIAFMLEIYITIVLKIVILCFNMFVYLFLFVFNLLGIFSKYYFTEICL